MVFRLNRCQPEVECRQQGENVCLDEGDKQFQQIHKNHEGNRNNRNPQPQRGAYRAENEDQAYESKYNDVPGGNVCKETDHQYEWFGDDPDDFNNRHQRHREFQPPGNPGGVDDIDPIVLVSADRGNDEGENSHDQRNGNVTGNIGATGKKRYQAEQVVEYDEKEDGQ